jgi:hypothetical protein
MGEECINHEGHKGHKGKTNTSPSNNVQISFFRILWPELTLVSLCVLCG